MKLNNMYLIDDVKFHYTEITNEILPSPLKHFLTPYDICCCHIWCILRFWIVSSQHGFLIHNIGQNEETVLGLMIMIFQNQSFL